MAADGVVQFLPLQSHPFSCLIRLDVFPVFQVSQDNNRYFPNTSPVTLPAPGSQLHEATGYLDSIVGSPVMSLSITDFAAHLTLLSEQLIHIPDELLLLPMPVPLQPQPSPEGQPPLEPIASVDPYPVDLSREGPFDAYCEPGDTGGHPLISTGLPGCPYRMTTYREQDVAHVDPTFGVECIGRPNRPSCWVVPWPNGFR